MRYGALEAGGTKMVLAVADENRKILVQKSIPTLSPAETMPRMIEFFRENPVDVIGVASFGPVDLNTESKTYGYITNTPKPGWGFYPLMPELRDALKVPCGFDNDVNAAALGEAELGAARGTKNSVYVTVGTGIGAGVFSEGRLVHGLMHPEWGHILLAPSPDDPTPEGFCPFHKGCLEGLASGPAIEKRWGKPARELPPDHPAWKLEVYYLAQLCLTALMTVSPEKIILGGGVMSQQWLFPLVREETRRLVGGYLSCADQLDSIIVPPECFPVSGLLGAVLLAQKALEQKA